MTEEKPDDSKEKMINLNQLEKDIGEKLRGERCVVEKKTPCALCEKTIERDAILAVDRFFCTEYCRLKFWREENTGLGGSWITDENLSDMQNLVGEERKKEYDRIVNFIAGNIGATALMLRFRGDPKADNIN